MPDEQLQEDELQATEPELNLDDGQEEVIISDELPEPAPVVEQPLDARADRLLELPGGPFDRGPVRVPLGGQGQSEGELQAFTAAAHHVALGVEPQPVARRLGEQLDGPADAFVVGGCS